MINKFAFNIFKTKGFNNNLFINQLSMINNFFCMNKDLSYLFSTNNNKNLK